MQWKYNLIDWFITQRARWGKGQGEVAMLRGFIEMYILIEIYFATKLNYSPSISLLVLALIGLNILYWIVGFAWDKLGLYIPEAEFGNKRNQLMIQLRKKFNLPEPKK